MKIDLFYGNEKRKVEITENFEILIPNKVPIKKQDKLIENSLKNPIASEPCDAFIKKSDTLLVIVNDATRPTPTSKILEYLQPTLYSHNDVKFIIATGVHRAPTEEEYRFIFGETYEAFKDKIYPHDARRDEDMVVVLSLAGRLDLANGNKLKDEIKSILESGKTSIHLCMKDLEFVNSSGLGAMVSIMKEVRIQHGRLTLSDMADYVREVFDITQLSHIFEIFPTEEEALGSYQTAAQL